MQRLKIPLLLVSVVASLPALGQAPTKPVKSMGLHYYNPAAVERRVETLQADVCIYGGSSAGVAAALQLARRGKTCVVLEPSDHLGGLSSGGLGNTDIGNKGAIGGIAREFYRRVGRKYGAAEEWRFEPHVAEQVFNEMIQEAKAPVYFRQFLKSVEKRGARLTSVTMESGLTVRASAFIDATYEGDLMAKAGVKYHVGREANSVYGETLNGVQVQRGHQFNLPVDPYIVEGDPKSGLLPGINPGDPGKTGDGDHRVQAYNFRLCLTNDSANRIPYEKPAGYNPQEYVLLSRLLAKGWPESEVFRKFDSIRNKKVDKNNHGAVSTDYIGRNYDYPEADYATREKIFQEHGRYQKGLMWFLGNDPSVPETIRTKWSQWGLPKDEFLETGGWPHLLYVREARRMISDYVMTEHNCRGKIKVEDPIGLAAYTMDSHNCQRFVRDGRVWNEGDVQTGGFPPYPISYRSIVPKQSECENLLVPVCLAASHIAYGSIRMEPVFMIVGQSAASAAAIALDDKVPLQKVDYTKLRTRLIADQQILEWTIPPAVTRASNAASRFVRQLEAGKAQHIVMYGTSLTAGGAWVEQVQRALETEYPGLVTVTNSGGSGMNSAWGVENLQARVIDRKPDAVFIEFAVNDAVARFDLSVEQSRKNLEGMIDAIRKASPEAEIILQIMNPVIGRPEGDAGHRSNLPLYQQVVRDVAKERGLLLIDHTPAWQVVLDQGEDAFRAYAPDGLHPNAEGYSRFVTPTILKALGVAAAASPPEPLAGIVVDDADAKKTGAWVDSSRREFRAGTGYVHDDNDRKGESSIAFTPEIPQNGEYEIFFVFAPNTNRATNVPVTVSVEGGEAKTVTVNQKSAETGGRVSLGKHVLPRGNRTTVTISNKDTDGYVVADAVQFVPVK